MDTTKLNNNPTSGEKSEKAEKIKKAAGKAAQFAGAAGLGVAGTVAVNAMNKQDQDKNEAEAPDPQVDQGTPAAASGAAATAGAVTAEAATDFDPNDIMIETDDVEVVDDNQIEAGGAVVETSEADVALVEPLPITEENSTVYTQSDEVLIAQVERIDEPYIDVQPDMYGGPEGWENYDPEDLLEDEDLFFADNDDINDDHDIADDILA